MPGLSVSRSKVTEVSQVLGGTPAKVDHDQAHREGRRRPSPAEGPCRCGVLWREWKTRPQALVDFSVKGMTLSPILSYKNAAFGFLSHTELGLNLGLFQ